MLHIDESTLTVLLVARSVTHFELRESGRGFGVFVGIDASGAEAADGQGAQTGMLITSRMKHQKEKSPRTWASVDKFVHYLKAKVPAPPEIRIQFNEGGRAIKKTQQHP